MPLTKPQAPPDIDKAWRQGLAEMVGLGRAPDKLPPTGELQQVYSLSLRDVVHSTGLAGAKLVLWKCLVGDPKGPCVTCDVAVPLPGKPAKLTSLARGPIVSKGIQATRDVERLAQVQAHDYELRQLTIGGFLGAFWLVSLDGRKDLIVPYHALAEELTPMHAYSVDRFLSVIRPLAKKRLKLVV